MLQLGESDYVITQPSITTRTHSSPDQIFLLNLQCGCIHLKLWMQLEVLVLLSIVMVGFHFKVSAYHIVFENTWLSHWSISLKITKKCILSATNATVVCFVNTSWNLSNCKIWCLILFLVQANLAHCCTQRCKNLYCHGMCGQHFSAVLPMPIV